MAFLQLLQTSMKLLARNRQRANLMRGFRFVSSKFTRDSNDPCACPCCPQPCIPCEQPDPCDPYKKPRKGDPCEQKKRKQYKRRHPASPDPIPPPPIQGVPCKPEREDCSDC